MANVSQIEQRLKLVLEARASTLARETGFIKRQRKWSRADLIRPRLSDRKAFEAIVYVLRTGIQWNALPRELGASSTIPDRFQHWEQAGLFKALWQAGLSAYDELAGIQWDWQAAEGAISKDPDLRRRNRSQSHRSRQVGNQTQPLD